MYSKHVSVSHAAALHTALSVDCLIATQGEPSEALLANIFQHAPPMRAPPPVAWRLTVSIPKLGLAVEFQKSDHGSQNVLQMALRNVVVVLQDDFEVRHKPCMDSNGAST